MGPVHQYNDLKTLLENFAIAQGDYRFEPIEQGYINDTYLVLENEQPLYILQRINTEVFPDVTAVMGNIKKALNYLNDTDYTEVSLVPTRSGETFCRLDHKASWRLMGYVPNSIAHDNAKNPAMAFEAGRILGKFHTLLMPAPTEEFVDTIPRFHDLHLRAEQFEDTIERANREKLLEAESAVSFAKKTLPIFLELASLKLPVRICHNDTKLNNILFSQESNRALCFIDLDTLMRGYFYFDFGDLARTIANPAKEDEKEHQKISFDKHLFEVFLDGLASNGYFLSQEELKSLPLGTVLMPFIHGLRALTDFLNNNQYFKVSYPNQNLDRSLSLFDFSKKALNELSYIEEMVAKKLKHPQH